MEEVVLVNVLEAAQNLEQNALDAGTVQRLVVPRFHAGPGKCIMLMRLARRETRATTDKHHGHTDNMVVMSSSRAAHSCRCGRVLARIR